MAYKLPKPKVSQIRRKVTPLPAMPQVERKIYGEEELRMRQIKRQASPPPPLPTKPKVYRAVPGAGVKRR